MIRLSDRIRKRLSDRDSLTRRDRLKLFLPAVGLTIIGFVVAFQWVNPAPPKQISIACGPKEGANYMYAKAYKEIMAREGVTLNIKTTAGSVENLKLLEAENDGVDAAFVLGGLKSLTQKEDLASLGSLFFEPLWIFHRPGLNIEHITDMKGMRLGVGREGGGTRILTAHLLELNGISAKNTEILSIGYQKASDMLLKGEVDVAFFVSTHRAPYILKLIDSKKVKVMGSSRAEAYAFLYPYLYALKVPEGAIDFEANIPSKDLNLVAPTTELVARSDLHPSLVYLLMQTAAEVHKSGTEFEGQGQFPAPKYLDFPLSEEAERFYKHGPPFLQRYLPFWVANFINRMKVMLVPLIVLLFPLFKIMPLLYRWRMRSRIYRWYSELEAVDPFANKEEMPESLQEYLVKLDEIEGQVCNVTVPLAYSDGLYNLLMHIEMLRNKIRQAAEKNVTSGDYHNAMIEERT